MTDGFSSYLYTFPDDLDDNGRVNPNNTCFCNDKSNCLPEGLLDVRGCYYGFPIALSYPHFYKGDRSLVEGVSGTSPSKEKHGSVFVIEPVSSGRQVQNGGRLTGFSIAVRRASAARRRALPDQHGARQHRLHRQRPAVLQPRPSDALDGDRKRPRPTVDPL